MKIRKLLALALTGVTLLSTVPVHAQTTNSIGYTNFLFPEDGNNYFINAEHKFLGNLKVRDEDTLKYYVTDINNQEVNLPTKTWVSFDVTSLMYDFALEDKELKGLEYRDYKAITELVDYNNDFVSEKYDYYLRTSFSDTDSIKPSETATVTFTQDGKQLAKFTLNKNVLADNRHFSFYNKSTSPVKVTVDTDSWFAMDLGYTAHKANKKYITDSNWTFSMQPEKTYIAKITGSDDKDYVRDFKGIINYISVDGKPATVRVYQKGKLIQTKTVKSNTAFATKVLKKGKYTIKVNTKSSGYNLVAADRYTYYNNNKGKKSSIKMTKEVIGCTSSYRAPKKSLLINVVPTEGFLYYGETDGLSNGAKAYSPVFDIDTVRTGDGTVAGKNSNGYSVAVHGESLGNLNFDRLSW